MTAEEEGLFREAARKALSQSRDIVVASAGVLGCEDFTPPPFSLARFQTGVIAILVPDSWGDDPAIDERCQSILRQESKALVGQPLD